MKTRISRPLAVAALTLTAGALATGTASASPAEAPAAGPVAGSVELCIPIPIGPGEVNICL